MTKLPPQNTPDPDDDELVKKGADDGRITEYFHFMHADDYIDTRTDAEKEAALKRLMDYLHASGAFAERPDPTKTQVDKLAEKKAKGDPEQGR